MVRMATKVRVHGRVQGVGFRAWCRNEATGRGLDGWVCNEADGSVTAVLSGPGERVTEMIRALEHGPPAARVTAVEREALADMSSDGFRIVF